MSELLHITIDGKDCTCEKGEYLWDVAKRNGVFIPVFCRSDAFPDHRACCRVCIVEVEIRGRSKVVTSCVYPVEQECVVRTDSDRIKEERSVVLGLLAARAPEAQRVALLSKINGNDGFERLTVLDGEKCILCGLCVQACESLGTSAISTVNRGVDKEISTPYGDPSSSCVGCLSCANVCPTDAISYTQTPAPSGTARSNSSDARSAEPSWGRKSLWRTPPRAQGSTRRQRCAMNAARSRSPTR